jgi:hypothetical protein
MFDKTKHPKHLGLAQPIHWQAPEGLVEAYCLDCWFYTASVSMDELYEYTGLHEDLYWHIVHIID